MYTYMHALSSLSLCALQFGFVEEEEEEEEEREEKEGKEQGDEEDTEQKTYLLLIQYEYESTYSPSVPPGTRDRSTVQGTSSKHATSCKTHPCT